MSLKKIYLICIAAFSYIILNGQTITQKGDIVSLSNTKNEVSFNLKTGLFSVSESSGKIVAKDAYFQLGGLQSKDESEKITWKQLTVNDALGTGKTLEIQVCFDKYADIIWQATLYKDSDYILFNMGVDNDTDRDFRLMSFYPFVCKRMYEGIDNHSDYKVLDGMGGGGKTLVLSDNEVFSFNNLLVRFADKDQYHSLVAGGATYNEFEKFVRVNRHDKKVSMFLLSEDPVGRLVNAASEYILNDKFYLCFNNDNPFEALEKYGKTLKIAQNIKLNMYDFPTECLWYASHYNIDPERAKFNDTDGAITEADYVTNTGIDNYTRFAIRLVPDTYALNNQQGWWDDEHWAKYGDPISTVGSHYSIGYPTSKSWGEALTKKGFIPITYFQSGRRSEDFARQYPEYMLFNDSYREINTSYRFKVHVRNPEELNRNAYYEHFWTDKMLWGYDFTDPGFIKHIQKVYANLKEAGIKGIMYDYPEITAWGYEGGFENKHATTAYAYRNMFKLAYEGLGEDCYLDERNLCRGSDITLGLVASQRVWGDTDKINPEMVSRCGLRWYKNRTVVNYDMDSKDPEDAEPTTTRDGCRSMLSMCYITSGRFLLGRSISQLSPEQISDMSRTFPYHTTSQSARPLDAFNTSGQWPKVYDFKVDENWHQLAFYNYNMSYENEKDNTISVSLSNSLNKGGMQMDSTRTYYLYDFWNDRFVGKFAGTATIKQVLRPGETRVMSVHAAKDVPQFISTSRHIMQGYLDLKDCKWNEDKNVLEGTSSVIANEPYRVIIAANGKMYKRSKASEGKATVKPLENQPGLFELTLLNKQSKEVDWQLLFD